MSASNLPGKTQLSNLWKWGGLAGALAGGFLLLTGFGPAGAGWRSPDKIDKFITFRINDMLDDITATPTQREKVLAAKDAVLASFLKNRDSRRQTHQLLVAEWNSDTPDAKAVHAAIDAQIDAIRAMAHQAADQALEIHAVLTPEQRAQVAHRFGHGPLSMP